jgi:hypothetical protein
MLVTSPHQYGGRRTLVKSSTDDIQATKDNTILVKSGTMLANCSAL